MLSYCSPAEAQTGGTSPHAIGLSMRWPWEIERHELQCSLMAKSVRDLATRHAMGIALATIVLSFTACPGPDRLTDPMVSEGGTYFATLGASGNSGAQTGGTGSITCVSVDASSDDAGFDWGATAYDQTGGSSVTHQDHFNGNACFASCHAHDMTIGGTVYQANCTSPASGVQIGVLSAGTLFATYAGTKGNFFTTLPGNVDWTNADIAVRSARGTRSMSANPNATGDCNKCHDRNHRIVAP